MKKPDLAPRNMDLSVDYVNGLLGVTLKPGEIKGYLEKMRFAVDEDKGILKVGVPAYRTDVMHPIDLVEDVAIAYGYMNFKPEVPKLYQLGRAHPDELHFEEVRDIMVGLGFREVMTLILSNSRDLYERMNAPAEAAVEAVKPVSLEQGMARTWLLPALMVVLEKNRNREYPQQIFEVGDVIDGKGVTTTRVAGVIAHSRTNFSEIKAHVNGLIANLKIKGEEKPGAHPSFIEGRCGSNQMGFWGELSPQVITNFGIEVPVSAFELRLN